MTASRSDVDRSEPMSHQEFEAWAREIKLTDEQWLPVWYVIDREYDRGRLAGQES